MIITIDGPVASGKSSVARLIAQQLGFYHLNSGLVYRALAYFLLHERGYTQEMLQHPQQDDVHMYFNNGVCTYSWDDAGQSHMICNGRDTTAALKNGTIDQAASIVSTHAFVRALVNTYLNLLASGHNIVADGRDCGSMVFPHASLKVFLTASGAVRAERWRLGQEKEGRLYTQEETVALISERDARDSSRAVAPLTVTADMIVVDSTLLTVRETVEEIVKLFEKVGK